MISLILKEETALAHYEAEKELLPRITSIESYDDYGAILKTFNGFFYPVHNLIVQYISANELPDISARRNASLILKDLASIGDKTEDIEQCVHLPKIDNVAGAFGALYVLEGSSLGGRMISKMLMKNKHILLTHPMLHFFEGYKDETGIKWKSFLHALNMQRDADAAVKTANETFSLLKNWIIQSLYYERAI